ncbi:hypothetical protein AVEN_148512-1 [Araneus ventricosus]|uniref:Uncharacterized protein n=1 Tax=Araneus ventricosus TaxID=182803 RepID=A0A4Y2JTD9_ARAVE|nr:hypothetical protein AVEN_148512-1 [Araneus ventricosus]
MRTKLNLKPPYSLNSHYTHMRKLLHEDRPNEYVHHAHTGQIFTAIGSRAHHPLIPKLKMCHRCLNPMSPIPPQTNRSTEAELRRFREALVNYFRKNIVPFFVDN